MVQVQKHHLLPISLCLGYIPVLILIPSVSYNRGKRYEDDEKDSFVNGLLFLYFFPLYILCFLFIAFHILTIFYKNAWTAVLLNGVASLTNLFAGMALGSALILYRSMLGNEIVFREVKAIMTGVILLMIIQIVGYSSWPGFARMKRRCLQSTQLILQPRQRNRQQALGSTQIILIVLLAAFTIIGGIGLTCHAGGAISYTVVMGDDFKDSDLQDDDLYMFWLVSMYMVIGLYVLLVVLLILTIALPYEKYSWILYPIAPLNCLLQIFIGNSIFEAFFIITIYSQDTLDSSERKIFYSMISVSVGSMLLALSTVVYACCWSLKFWLNAAAASTSAETTQHDRNTAVEQTVPLIRNEDNDEPPWIGNVPYPNVVITRDTRQYHDDDDDDDEKLLQY